MDSVDRFVWGLVAPGLGHLAVSDDMDEGCAQEITLIVSVKRKRS